MTKEDSEPKTPIATGTTNQKTDCNEITKITDTQTMDEEKTTNKSVNKNNLSPNIKQNKLQVHIKQEGITDVITNLYKIYSKNKTTS